MILTVEIWTGRGAGAGAEGMGGGGLVVHGQHCSKYACHLRQGKPIGCQGMGSMPADPFRMCTLHAACMGSPWLFPGVIYKEW